MTHPTPPSLPYQAPKSVTPNVGTRAATVSWLAPLASLLVFSTALLANPPFILFGGGGIALWIIGLVSGVVALKAMKRYGRNRIRRPAIVGLCLTLIVFLLVLAVACIAIFFVGALDALKRPWGNFI